MIEAPYIKDRLYDDVFDKVLDDISLSANKNDDDFLLLCVGNPGTGKSMLMLHAEDKYLEEESSVDYVGLNRGDFSKALKLAKNKPLPRFCGNDEANISKRDGQTAFVKDMIDLYFSIRGLNIFHWWNNPSIDMIDKSFIKERIKGVIYIATKDKKRPRIYYYFRKIDILKIFEKYECLDLPMLKKVASEYAYYRGWFKDYTGKLKEPYAAKKGARMEEKVDNFYLKYGHTEDTLTGASIQKALHISDETFRKYLKLMQDENAIPKDSYVTSPTGRKFFTQDFLSAISERIKKTYDKQVEVLSEASKLG